LMHETEHLLRARHSFEVMRKVALDLTQKQYERWGGKGMVQMKGNSRYLVITWPRLSNSKNEKLMKYYCDVVRLIVLKVDVAREEVLADQRALWKYRHRFGDPIPKAILDGAAAYSAQNAEVMDDFLNVFKVQEQEIAAAIEDHFDEFDQLPNTEPLPPLV